MKDKHNVILILVSSKCLIPSSRVRSWYQILGSKLFIFSFRSSKLFQLYHFKASSNHCKASPGVLFNFSFRFDHSFITGVLLGGSTWWFVKDSFHFSIVLQDFSWSYDPPGYTKKINMVFNRCLVFRSSSILHFAFLSAILPTLSFEVVLCHSWQFEFAFHDSHAVKNEIF